MQSPGFSDFRSLMDLWDEQLEKAERDKIRAMLDSNGFVFFFKKDNEFFAAGEDSRLTFARMKNPDEETDKDWGKDAAFKGVSLNAALTGEKKLSMFYLKDLKSIKVLDQEDAYKELTKLAEKKPSKRNLQTVLADKDDDYEDIAVPPNQRQIGDDV
jgi:hypothetical protein